MVLKQANLLVNYSLSTIMLKGGLGYENVFLFLHNCNKAGRRIICVMELCPRSYNNRYTHPKGDKDIGTQPHTTSHQDYSKQIVSLFP